MGWGGQGVRCNMSLVTCQTLWMLRCNMFLRTQEETITHLLPHTLALGWLRGAWRRRTLASVPTRSHLVAAWIMSCHRVSPRGSKSGFLKQLKRPCTVYGDGAKSWRSDCKRHRLCFSDVTHYKMEFTRATKVNQKVRISGTQLLDQVWRQDKVTRKGSQRIHNMCGAIYDPMAGQGTQHVMKMLRHMWVGWGWGGALITFLLMLRNSQLYAATAGDKVRNMWWRCYATCGLGGGGVVWGTDNVPVDATQLTALRSNRRGQGMQHVMKMLRHMWVGWGGVGHW